ncbi:MAG: Flp family type IVb pilin [Syntrophomonas sp.]
MLNTIKRLVKEEEGQGMAEYGLILALIAIVVMGSLTLMQTGLTAKFTKIGTDLGGTTT